MTTGSRLADRFLPSFAVLLAVVIYYRLPERFTLGPSWLLPSLELLLLVPLAMPFLDETFLGRHRRLTTIALVSIVTVGNITAVVTLIASALIKGNKASGLELLDSAVELWLTNVIAFALWYWELDRGGPRARAEGRAARKHFWFLQDQQPQCDDPDWRPSFIDYLYLAFTNATAFSPADTLPVTATAKVLMSLESLTSLCVLALIAGRAINILS